MKSVQIRSCFWSVFSRTQAEYGDLLRKSPYSTRVRENTDQKNSVFGHLSRSVTAELNIYHFRIFHKFLSLMKMFEFLFRQKIKLLPGTLSGIPLL